MTIAETLLPEFDREMASTRKTIERIPNDKLDWKAHPKSRTMGWVGSHLAEIAGWVEGILTQDSWDIAPESGESYQAPQFDSLQDILDFFDANVAAGRKCIGTTSDEEFAKSWSLLSGGQALIIMPKAGVIRTWILNHSIHHRGHLCVYLRLNDIPVPALYGPSGDEES
ncbi:MAG: DinB family protein [Gimesia sp.]